MSLLSSVTTGRLSGGASGGGSRDKHLSSFLCVVNEAVVVFSAAMIGAVLEV